MVYLPRHVHRMFRILAHHFGDVFHEVAIPTIVNELDAVGLATWSKVDCLGSCCSRLGWDVVGADGVLCAHRIDIANNLKWNRNEGWRKGDVCARAMAAAKLHGGE